MDGIRPNAALTSITVTGSEVEGGTTENWTLVAQAVCAPPVPGLELVSAKTEPDSDLAASVTASCPAGKNLLGAGGAISGGDGQVVIDDLRPNAALTSVLVSGFEDENGTAANWSATAYAICASP